MNIHEAHIYLESFINYEKNLQDVSPFAFRLDRIRQLLALLGNPQDHMKIVHVAGTKGKGSTCALTANILKHAGYRVGLYTSPHLNNMRERIRVLGLNDPHHISSDIFPDMITEIEFCHIIEETKEKVEQLRSDTQLGQLTFFEVYTALALYYFYKRRAEVAVLETGVGGRLDATNAVSSQICAITPISLEHTHLLGKTIQKIAQEKGAIIKQKGQKVIIGPQKKQAGDVLKKRCSQFNIRPMWVGRDIDFELIEQDVDHQAFKVKSKKKQYSHLELTLAGRHQLINAATAIGIIESMEDIGFPVSTEAMQEGLKVTKWPGRFETVKKEPLTILDGAHNEESSHALVETVQELLPKRDVTLILGISDLKDKISMCREFNRIAHLVITTKSKHPRAGELKEDEVKAMFPGRECFRTNNVAQAMDLAYQKSGKEDVILVSGSLFVVSEARALCIN